MRCTATSSSISLYRKLGVCVGRIMYFIRGYDYALRYAQAKYELLFMTVLGKIACAVNRIYRPNHSTPELRVLRNSS